ncbi:MAG: hypothetical protein LBJ09_02670 [Clostridiales bacterium]|nr:hypothetical protein [Clostridiales bacterium]
MSSTEEEANKSEKEEIIEVFEKLKLGEYFQEVCGKRDTNGVIEFIEEHGMDTLTKKFYISILYIFFKNQEFALFLHLLKKDFTNQLFSTPFMKYFNYSNKKDKERMIDIFFILNSQINKRAIFKIKNNKELNNVLKLVDYFLIKEEKFSEEMKHMLLFLCINISKLPSEEQKYALDLFSKDKEPKEIEIRDKVLKEKMQLCHMIQKYDLFEPFILSNLFDNNISLDCFEFKILKFATGKFSIFQIIGDDEYQILFKKYDDRQMRILKLLKLINIPDKYKDALLSKLQEIEEFLNILDENLKKNSPQLDPTERKICQANILSQVVCGHITEEEAQKIVKAKINSFKEILVAEWQYDKFFFSKEHGKCISRYEGRDLCVFGINYRDYLGFKIKEDGGEGLEKPVLDQDGGEGLVKTTSGEDGGESLDKATSDEDNEEDLDKATSDEDDLESFSPLIAISLVQIFPDKPLKRREIRTLNSFLNFLYNFSVYKQQMPICSEKLEQFTKDVILIIKNPELENEEKKEKINVETQKLLNIDPYELISQNKIKKMISKLVDWLLDIFDYFAGQQNVEKFLEKNREKFPIPSVDSSLEKYLQFKLAPEQTTSITPKL